MALDLGPSSSAISVCLVIHPISIVIQGNFLPSGDRTCPISLFNVVLRLPLKHQQPPATVIYHRTRIHVHRT